MNNKLAIVSVIVQLLDISIIYVASLTFQT